MIDLDALEALIKRGGAYGDERTTLDLIGELRRARACVEKVRRADGFETKRGGTWIGVVWRSVLDAILAEYDKETSNE